MERTDERFLMQDEPIGDLHELRLMALLRELVGEHGLRGAARHIEIDHRTIAGCMHQGVLTPTAKRALERALHLGMGSVFEELAGRVSALESRVEEIGGRLRKLSQALEEERTESKASLESLLKMVRANARQVDKLGVSERKSSRSADGGDGDKQPASPKTAGAKESQQTTKWFPRRTYTQLVTKVPAEDDEHVYKEAWPVVREWREVENGHRYKGKTLTWMKRHERLLELERRLLDEFQLTLPPARHPIDKEMRRKLLRWNEDDLRSIRGRIVRRLMLRWVRRILTVGLWRK